MADGVRIDKLEAKSHDTPDEVRTPNKTRMEIVRLGGGLAMGRMILEPGWRWSDCIKPIVGTDSCQVTHAGYAVSGRLTVKMLDGSQKTIGKNMSYVIPPGHDAWVEGNEPFVGIEVMSAEQYAKR
jgi:hypothetical protein